MPIYNFISSILIETNDSVLNKVPVSLEAAAAVNVSPWLRQLWAAEKRLWNTDDVDVTFTHVVVDLVACGAGDGSLTDETAHSIYTAFIQMAGVQRQTLVDVCVYWYKEKKKEMKKTSKFELSAEAESSLRSLTKMKRSQSGRNILLKNTEL